VAHLPRELLEAEVTALLREDDIYLVEQIGKKVDVISMLDPGEMEQRMYRALADGRVDDFCYLFGALRGRIELDARKVESAYALLACRGNVAGIETVIARTGVEAHLDPRVALRAYEVLVAMGRLGAVDYVRQLSGVPPRFSAHAVQLGYRMLLLAGRCEAMHALRRLSGVEPELAPDEVALAIGRAVEDLAFGALARLAELVPQHGISLKGFSDHLQRVVLAGRFSEIPPLFRLSTDARADGICSEALLGLVKSGDPACLAFVFSLDALGDLHHELRLECYRLGVETRHRGLVRAVCERMGISLAREHAGPLLSDALDAEDIEWLRFAASELGTLPEMNKESVQALLFDLFQRGDPRLAQMQALMGVELDEPLGRFCWNLKRGNLEHVAKTSDAYLKGSPMATRIRQALTS